MTIKEIEIQIALGTMTNRIFWDAVTTADDPEVLCFLFDHITTARLVTHHILEAFHKNPITPQPILQCMSKSPSYFDNSFCYLNGHYQHYQHHYKNDYQRS